MSWQEAKQAATEWSAAMNIPDDLRGKMIVLPIFETDADCAFFHPERRNAFHVMMVQALQRTYRKAGAKIVLVGVKPREFRAWLRQHEHDDSPETRAEFIRAQFKVA